MSDPRGKGLVGQATEQGQAIENLSKTFTGAIDQIQRPTYFHANTVSSGYLTAINPTYAYLSKVSAGGAASWGASPVAVMEVNVPASCELLIEAQGTWAMARTLNSPYTQVEYLQCELVNVTDASNIEVLRIARHNVLHDLSPRSDYAWFNMTKRVTPPANSVYRVGVRAWKTTTDFSAFLYETYEISITPRYVRAGTQNRK